MSKINFHKVVAALPPVLEANSVYYVRVGTGFDQYITNSTGTIAAYSPNVKIPTAEEITISDAEGYFDANNVEEALKQLAEAMDPAEIKSAYESNANTNAFTDAEKSKLAGIASGATANATNAQLRDRSTHTGTQAISTVSGLQTALDSKVDDDDARLTDAREWTASTVTQAEAEAGTATTRRAWTAQRVRQAVIGWWNSSTEKTKLDGIATGATKNATDAQLRDRTTHTGVQPIASVEGLQDALDDKVDNADPRMTNSREWTASVVSQAEAEAGTATTARKWTAQRVRQAILGWWNTSTFKTKLDGIESGATKNATDAQLRDRATHTGVQPISSVDGLQSAIDSKVNNDDARLTNSREWTASVVTQAEAEAGTATTARKWTAQRVRQAILGWWNSSAEKTKLDGIATGATKNATDAQLRDRSTHTGTQDISTISGLDDALDSKVDKVLGKQLSTEDYTSAEKTKLSGIATGATKNATDAQLRDRSTHTGTQAISTVSGLQTALDAKVDKVEGKGLSTNDLSDPLYDKLVGLEGTHWRGTFVSLAALEAGVTDPQAGDYADVDSAGADVERYIWDATDNKWVVQSGEVTTLTASQVKLLYESNPDTNAFTDADAAKLDSVKEWATAETQDAAQTAFGMSTSGKAVATGTPAQGRTALGLGTAATADAGDFDPAGSAANALSSANGYTDSLVGDIGAALDAINGEVV